MQEPVTPLSTSGSPPRTRRLVAWSAALAVLAPLVPAAPASGEPATPATVVVDTSSDNYAETGRWLTSGLAGSYGPVSRYSRPTSAESTATWRPALAAGGGYDVYTWYPAHENRASDSPFTVHHAAGSDTHRVDQRVDGSRWRLLGTYQFDAGPAAVRLTNDADGVVGADAVAFVPSGEPAPPGPEPAPGDISPTYRESQLLFDADPAGTKPFLAFPTLLKVNDNRVLVSYKRGDAHCADPERALLETITYDPRAEQVAGRSVTGDTPGVIYQNPQYVPMPNGDIHLMVDRQQGGAGCGLRIGLEDFVSTDGGDTFTSRGPLGLIDGYEYGYAFDYHIEGDAVYVLVMAFPDLGAPGREVHVIKSTDNGASWRFVANLTEKLGVLFNESALAPYGDGFLVAVRTDAGAGAALYRTDADFRKLDEADLTARYPSVPTIGRPRIVVHRGEYYLLGLSRPSGESVLKLHHLDPGTLEITASIELAHTTITTDSYYADHYTQVSGGVSYFNVVAHELLDTGERQNIVRYEFRWDELRLRLNEDFDSRALGEPPAGWVVPGDPSAVTVAPLPSADDRSLRLTQQPSRPAVQAAKVLTPATDDLVAEFSVLPGQTDASFTAGLSGWLPDPAAGVTFGDDGQLRAYGGGQWHPLGAYQADRWHRVRIVADPVAQRFDVAVDGETVAEGIPFAAPAEQLGWFMVASRDGQPGYIHIDDVVVH